MHTLGLGLVCEDPTWAFGDVILLVFFIPFVQISL